MKTWILRNNYGRTAETNQSNYDAIKDVLRIKEEVGFLLKRPDKIADLIYELMKGLKYQKVILLAFRLYRKNLKRTVPLEQNFLPMKIDEL